MAQLKTVRIKADNETGSLIINESDLTKAHTLFVEDEKPTETVPKNIPKKAKGGKR